jgi:hypothetical protein
VNLPIVVIALIATQLVVPESRSPKIRRFDVLGLALGTGCVTALVLAIIQGPDWSWTSSSTLVLFGASAFLLVMFVRYELRREGPLLDVRVFRNRSFSAGAASIATSFFCLFGFIFLVTQYFQLIHGYSALSAGVHTLPFAIVTMIFTPLGAVAALRVGARFVVSVGFIIMAAALLWMTSIGPHAAYFGPVIEAMVLLALGFSLIGAPSTAAIMGSLHPEQLGAGAAVNETTREMGGTLGVAVVGSVFSSVFAPQIRHALLHLGLSSAQLKVAEGSMQASRMVLAHVPSASPIHASLVNGVTTAFMDGFHRGCFVAGMVALVVGVLVFSSLPRHVLRPDEMVHA